MPERVDGRIGRSAAQRGVSGHRKAHGHSYRSHANGRIRHQAARCVEDLRHASRGIDAGDHARWSHQARGARTVRMRGRHRGLLVRGPARRDLLRHGAVGVRQVDHGPTRQPADRADHRAHRGAWAGRHGARRRRLAKAARRPHRHGVPAHGVVPAPHGARQRRLSPAGAGPAEVEALGGLPALLEPRESRRLRGPVPQRAVGRHAATGRARPGVGVGPRGAADGRAVLRARPAHPAPASGAVHDAFGRAEQDHGVHHPRSGRGDSHRQPDRDHEGRPNRADRHPRRDRDESDRRLRTGLRGRHLHTEADLRPYHHGALRRVPAEPGRRPEPGAKGCARHRSEWTDRRLDHDRSAHRDHRRRQGRRVVDKATLLKGIKGGDN